MFTIDPQTTQQIVQFLTTYGTDAGIAAAGAVGTGTVQALGSGAMFLIVENNTTSPKTLTEISTTPRKSVNRN